MTTTRSAWRRFWPVAALAAAVLFGWAAREWIYWSIREPPNYDEIEPGLMLGARVDRPPPGTQSVLNLCEAEDPYQAEVHRWSPIADAEPPPPLAWLREQVDFLTAERQAGRAVFVHCQNGVSRSGLVVVAYLMQSRRCSRDEALALVRAKRPIVRPHPAFMRLLLEWESSVASEL